MKVALRDMPSFYMSKLAYGPRVIDYMKKRGDSFRLEMPIAETLAIVARALDKRVQDVVVMMLDRPRHKEIVEQIRGGGRVVADDRRWRHRRGHGAVVARKRGRSLHGDRRFAGSGAGRRRDQMSRRRDASKMWPRDDKERKKLVEDGWEKDLDRIYFADDLAHGENIIFCATGISDSALLRGVKATGHERDDAFDFDAGQKQDRAVDSRPPQFAEENHPAALG